MNKFNKIIIKKIIKINNNLKIPINLNFLQYLNNIKIFEIMLLKFKIVILILNLKI